MKTFEISVLNFIQMIYKKYHINFVLRDTRTKVGIYYVLTM